MVGARQTRPAATVELLRDMVDYVPYTNLEIERLIGHVPDLDLLATALSMRPRPGWVHTIATTRPAAPA